MVETPVAAAAAFDRSFARRKARVLADASQRLIDARLPLPNAIRWRARQAIFDRPPEIAVHPAPGAGSPRGRRVLLVTNDLSRSGAPQLLVEVALAVQRLGHHATFASAIDGPLREDLLAAGIGVIVDPTLHHPSNALLPSLAGAIDLAICNTVVTAGSVAALARATPVIWYLHEISLLEERLASDPVVAESLHAARRVWAGSVLSADLARRVRADVAVVPYGLDPIGRAPVAGAHDGPLRLGVFASIESRKGQDLLLAAMNLLSPEERAQVAITLYGRALDAAFLAGVEAAAAALPQVTMGGALDTAGYRAAMLACDAVCIPSRDDTLPLVSLDALGAARVLMCTATTGTAGYLDSGRSGFVAARPDAEAIAAMLRAGIAARADWPEVAAAGQAVFQANFSRAQFDARLGETIAAVTA